MDCSGCWYANVSNNSTGAWLEQTAGRRQQYYGGQPSVSQGVLPPTRSLDDEMTTTMTTTTMTTMTTTDAQSMDDMSMAETTEHGVKRKNLFMAPQEKRNKWQVVGESQNHSAFGFSNTISPRDNVSHMQQKRVCSFSGVEIGSLAKRKYIGSKEQTCL
jgi:hypothetical protein